MTDAEKQDRSQHMLRRIAGRAASGGGILLFFIMAFEVMIMISPFAFFFYSVFNPIFHGLERYAATRWLTAFFLPHMVLPPTPFLKGVRVLGSVLFVLGCASFIVCALQVYLGKIFHWGVAHRGLYSYVRHPQYLSLGIWGVGMSILWPRFIVLASLSLMFLLYYWLARDEERRMLAQHGDSYARYRESKGMFFPRAVDRGLGRLAAFAPAFARRPAVACALVVAVVIGAGFLLRTITLSSLPLESRGDITLLPLLPEQDAVCRETLNGLLDGNAPREALHLSADKDYLGYVMPPDYIMQGMIADTGDKAHLFKQHHTVMLIADWVLNPFEHLRRPASAQVAKMHGVDPAVARRHHCPLGIADADLSCDDCPYRRVILIRVDHPGTEHSSGKALLAMNTGHVPVAVVDLDTRTGTIVKVTAVGETTAWKNVPTPVF